MSHDETLREIELDVTADSRRATGEAATWAWATKNGAAEWASTEQLAFWLGRGDLPPTILVWKPGLGEWLPALEVAELAALLSRRTPGSQAVAQKASNAPAPGAAPSSPTLSPHAMDLALPALRAAAPGPEQVLKHDGGWGWLGTLIVGAIAVLSLGSSWAAFSLAMSAMKPVDPSSPQSSSSAQPAASGAVLRAPASAAEPASVVPAEAKHSADRVPLTREPKPAVLRVGDLPTSRPRALPPRTSPSRHASSRH